MNNKYISSGFIIILVLCISLPIFGQNNEAQELPRWQLYLCGSSYYISRANNWNFGPELTISYSISQPKGIYLSVIYPTIRMTSKGYGFREGLAFDLGAWLTPWRMQSWLRLGAGFNYIFGSDADGSILRAFGAHISTQAIYWLKNQVLGLGLRGVVRYWFSEMHRDSRLTPSFSAGIILRF